MEAVVKQDPPVDEFDREFHAANAEAEAQYDLYVNLMKVCLGRPRSEIEAAIEMLQYTIKQQNRI